MTNYKKYIKATIFSTIFISSFLLCFDVFAATAITVPNPVSGTNDLYTFIERIFDNVIVPVGGIVVALGIIWSGFLFVTAQGNPAKIATAQKAFFWSFIGALVLLGSWAIANGIAATVEAIRTGAGT